MLGTLLAVVLAQFEADHYVERLYKDMSSKQTAEWVSDLMSFEERIHEEILMYLDQEDKESERLVAVRVPTSPNGHTTHIWHMQRVPVRKAIEVLSETAHWYSEVAERSFGVIHEWHKM
jgi:hypothetical protein